MEAATNAAAIAVPRRLRMLVGVFAAGGLFCLVVAITYALPDWPHGWWKLPVSLALIALSRVAYIRLQLGSSCTSLDWGEAALIIAFFLVGPAWLVVMVCFGAAVGHAWTHTERIKLIFNVSASTVATALSALVYVAIAGWDTSDPFTTEGTAGLIAAAAVASIATDIACAAAVSLSRPISMRAIVLDGLGAKALGLIISLTIGFGVIAIGQLNPKLLLALPPVLWLLQQGFAGRIRARTERRTWQQLARATHGLNKLDVDGVICSAVEGAATLFCADTVEVELSRPVNRPALTRGDAAGALWRGGANTVRPEPTVFSAALAGPSGAVMGEVRLCFRSEVTLDERERLALSTFADALASALRNAEIHEQLKELADRKAYEAAHDSLTGLANRSYFLEAGDQALESDRAGAVALLLLDFDHFKEVNDTLGHDSGDDLLCRAARRMVGVTRLGEVLARLGGDEFALLMPALPDDKAATREAQRRAMSLLASVAAPMNVGMVELSVEASVGVAVASVGACDIAELFRRADIAMYQAKDTGRTVVDYNADLDEGSIDRLALASEMQVALECGGQIVLNLQPTIDLATGAPLAAEALVRWEHPRRGRLGPSEFITHIEQTDLIGPLTRHILDLALSTCADWKKAGFVLPVAVNLSARALLDRDLPADVGLMLQHHGVPPAQLVLEITETAMMSELDVVEVVLNALREMGVQLSLDDFGTGYSSLTFLARVKVDEVKIDQGFVAAMHSSKEAAAIVRTTVELGRSLGLRVIAEGVENADQRAALTQLGCHGAQGYHLYPPMSPDKARAAMSAAAQSAASRSTATIIPLSVKRAAWLGHQRHNQAEHAAAEDIPGDLAD